MNHQTNLSPLSQVDSRFLIVDDDKVVTTVFQAHLKNYFPSATIEVENNPRILPGYDVYFIDNDFGGEHRASDLIDEIRRVEPQALVVTLSTTIDLAAMHRLVNLGCNAVYSKKRPSQSTDARNVIANYLSLVQRQRGGAKERHNFSNTINSLFDLLGEWNKRLSADVSHPDTSK